VLVLTIDTAWSRPSGREGCGDRNLDLHDLWHTFGSWKISQGEDVVYVSKQPGHKDSAVMLLGAPESSEAEGAVSDERELRKMVDRWLIGRVNGWMICL
jgi:hypothetical protein